MTFEEGSVVDRAFAWRDAEDWFFKARKGHSSRELRLASKALTAALSELRKSLADLEKIRGG